MRRRSLAAAADSNRFAIASRIGRVDSPAPTPAASATVMPMIAASDVVHEKVGERPSADAPEPRTSPSDATPVNRLAIDERNDHHRDQPDEDRADRLERR